MTLRLLIVDDSARFVEAARDLLERDGCHVVGVAATAAEALRQVSDLKPDVTLVDIDLGNESGFDVVDRISRQADRETRRVILISTYAEQDVRDLVAASGAIGFVSKSELSAAAIRGLLSSGDG